MKKYTLYRLVNEEIGAEYFGVTSKTLAERLKTHWHAAPRNKEHPLYDLMKEHAMGWVMHPIMTTTDRKVALDYELGLIKEFGSGLNLVGSHRRSFMVNLH